MLRFLLLAITLLSLSRSIGQQAVDLVVQTGHGSDVNGVAFSPDGKYLASACYDGSVKIWDAKLGLEIFKMGGFEKWASSVCFSSNGKYLIGSGGKLNIVWDVNTGKKLHVLALPMKKIPKTKRYQQFLPIMAITFFLQWKILPLCVGKPMN